VSSSLWQAVQWDGIDVVPIESWPLFICLVGNILFVCSMSVWFWFWDGRRGDKTVVVRCRASGWGLKQGFVVVCHTVPCVSWVE
jgi:hypothetical protein